jgi:hypothetical protein
MPVHSGPVVALAVLLLIAGAQKVVDPSNTSGALRAAGLPGDLALVRLLGAVEAALAAAFIVTGAPWAAVGAGVSYAGFSWFVANALIKRLPISSCGCLGAAETPPSLVHLVVNLVAVALFALAAIIPVGPLGGLWGEEMSIVMPYLLFLAAVVYFLYAALTVLPLGFRPRRRVTAASLPDPVRR